MRPYEPRIHKPCEPMKPPVMARAVAQQERLPGHAPMLWVSQKM
jgi:hypothetical protein